MSTTARDTISAYIVFFCIAIFYSYQYIIRILPNSISMDLTQIYGISSGEFGSFAGVYYLGYVISHIPLSILLLRSWTKFIVSLSILLTGFSLIPIIYSDNWVLVLICRFISGIGSSCAVLIAFLVFQELFYKRFSQVLGLMILLGLITGFLSGRYLSEIILIFGMKNVLKILFLFCIFLCILNYCFFPKLEVNSESGDKPSLKEDIKYIFFNKKFVFISFCAAFMVGPLEGFSDAWGSMFLVISYDLQKILADHIISNIFFGMSFGVIVLPYFADKFSLSYSVMLASSFFMGIFFLYILNIHNIDLFTVKILLFLIGFFCAYQSVFPSIVFKLVPERIGVFAASVANMIIMSFGFVVHKVIGSILSIMSVSDDSAINGRVYSKLNFKVAIHFIPILLIIAFITLFLMKNKFARLDLKK